MNSLLPPNHPEPDYQLMPAMDDPGASPASPLRLKRLLLFLRRFWWIPLITLILGLGAGGAIAWKGVPVFISRAAMWETVKLRLPEGGAFTEEVQTFLGTQTELLKSTTVRNLALARLRRSYTNEPIPLGEDGEPLPVDIRVSGNAKSVVFSIEATSANPAFTPAYLDALMAEFLEYKKNSRQMVSGDTLGSISKQVLRWETDLRTEQDTLTAFQRTNNLAILVEEGTVAGGHRARLETRLSDLQLEDRLLQATLNFTNPPAGSTNTGPDLVDAAATVASGTALSLRNDSAERPSSFKELQILQMQREKLSRYLRPRHPKIVKLDADIERLTRLQEISRRESRDQLALRRRSIQIEIENVQAEIRKWERIVLEARDRIAEAERLKLNVQRVQAVYDKLVSLEQNIGINSKIDQENLAVLQPATPAKRSYAKEKSGIIMSGMLGLLLGLGIVAMIGLRDDRFTSLSEVNERIGEVIVGQVPEVPLPGKNGTLPLLAHNDPRHAYAESFRSLRSAVLFMNVEGERPRVLLITSALPHEGKSTVAANLARTLALGGARVALIDADLRKGVLHDLLGLQRGPGLAEVLSQPDDLDKILQHDPLLNLSFLSCGQPSRHSGDLLLGPAFTDLITRLREKFDFVVIDTSPVLAADDAATLAPRADATLFVVRSRFSRAGPVSEALAQLYQRRARVMGLIYTQADTSSRSYYYYKEADYYQAATVEAGEKRG